MSQKSNITNKINNKTNKWKEINKIIIGKNQNLQRISLKKPKK